ncbi:MAG: Nif3-like dinuclear metal center hexameric protein [Desulfovibrionaceae bacterium]|nr:Nif3-like dinuclear metal center hexameric protein [Desulfovibrionaceae bacterium]
MQLAEIIAQIENVAPLCAAAPWDMSGMQVAARRTEIQHLALCLDPTPQSLAAAVALGATLVLSHHPLALKPRLPAQLDSYHAALSLLFQHDVALYAAHTSLDANPEGCVSWLAQELGLTEKKILEPTSQGYGFGLCGNCPPCTLEGLLTSLKQHVHLGTATLSGSCPTRIQRIAYCTGSGASLINAAKAAGADIFITGDVKYHAALEAEVCVLDVGHHSLEEEMMRRFAALLAPRLAAVRVSFIPSQSPFTHVS